MAGPGSGNGLWEGEGGGGGGGRGWRRIKAFSSPVRPTLHIKEKGSPQFLTLHWSSPKDIWRPRSLAKGGHDLSGLLALSGWSVHDNSKMSATVIQFLTLPSSSLITPSIQFRLRVVGFRWSLARQAFLRATTQ